MENVTLTFKVELTARQAEILRPWENMNEWLTNYVEKEIYRHLEKMSYPEPL